MLIQTGFDISAGKDDCLITTFTNCGTGTQTQTRKFNWGDDQCET